MKKTMKWFAKGIGDVFAMVVFAALVIGLMEEYSMFRGNTTVTTEITTEGMDEFGAPGKRTTTSSPYGIIALYEDNYIDGGWARGITLLGHLKYNPYIEGWQWV